MTNERRTVDGCQILVGMILSHLSREKSTDEHIFINSHMRMLFAQFLNLDSPQNLNEEILSECVEEYQRFAHTCTFRDFINLLKGIFSVKIAFYNDELNPDIVRLFEGLPKHLSEEGVLAFNSHYDLINFFSSHAFCSPIQEHNGRYHILCVHPFKHRGMLTFDIYTREIDDGVVMRILDFKDANVRDAVQESQKESLN